METLKSIDTFALGGVGVAGIPSKGETAFRSVLAGPDALTTFRTILEKGKPAAQLYALCGIRMLAEKELAGYAAQVIKKGGQVETMRGCIIAKEPIERVVQQICDGTLDGPLKEPRFHP